MAEPVRTALVGYGFAGQTFHAPLIRATPGLRLTHIVSRSAGAQPDDVKIVPDLEAVLNEPSVELIVIATPNDLHAPQGLAALKAGKHVVIDKPFALNLAETQALIEASKTHNRLAVPFHNRHWDSDFLCAKSVLDQGLIGQPYRYTTRLDRFRPHVRDRWREGDGPGSGLWYDLGPHLLYMTLSLFGDPDWVSADIATQRPGAKADDAFIVTLGRGSLRMILEASLMAVNPGPRFEIHGDRGSFIKHGIDTQEDALKAGHLPKSPGFGADPSPGQIVYADGTREIVPAPDGRYITFYEDMAEAIRNNASPPVKAEEALKVIDLIEAGQLSAREGRRLQL